jgi:hypothetical protein
VDYAKRKCPSLETDANLVIDLNDIHTELFVKLKRLSAQYEQYEASTVADQPAYTLPTGCKFENIIKVQVGTSSENTDYDEYKYAPIVTDIAAGNFYVQGTEGTYFLFQDELAINEAGRSIRIFYYPRPTEFTSSDMTVVPDLDEDYHNYLKYRLIAEIASQGNNPRTQIADYWQRKADEFLADITRSLSDRFNAIDSCEIEERM